MCQSFHFFTAILASLFLSSSLSISEWGLCEYVIVHTKLPHSPVILWTELGGKPKWLPLSLDTMMYNAHRTIQQQMCNGDSFECGLFLCLCPQANLRSRPVLVCDSHVYLQLVLCTLSNGAGHYYLQVHRIQRVRMEELNQSTLTYFFFFFFSLFFLSVAVDRDLFSRFFFCFSFIEL